MNGLKLSTSYLKAVEELAGYGVLRYEIAVRSVSRGRRKVVDCVIRPGPQFHPQMKTRDLPAQASHEARCVFGELRIELRKAAPPTPGNPVDILPCEQKPAERVPS